MTDLLALGIEQEGAHRRRSHIRPGCGPDHGWGDGGYACRHGAGLGAGARKFSAILVHTPTEITLPVALQGDEVAQVVTLGHILVVPGCAPVVFQQAFPPALTDCPRPLGGLWRWSTVGRSGARWSLGAGDFMAISVHTPAEAGAAMALQRHKVSLVVALGDVDP